MFLLFFSLSIWTYYLYFCYFFFVHLDILFMFLLFFLCPFGHIIYVFVIFSLSIWTYYLCFRYFFFVHLDILFMFPLFFLCPFGHIIYASAIFFLCPFGRIVYVSVIFFLSTWTILYFYAKTLINNKNLKKRLRFSLGLLVSIPSILEIRTYGLSASRPLFCYYSVVVLSGIGLLFVCVCRYFLESP